MKKITWLLKVILFVVEGRIGRIKLKKYLIISLLSETKTNIDYKELFTLK